MYAHIPKKHGTIKRIKNEKEDHIYCFLTISTLFIDNALVIAVGQITALTNPRTTCHETYAKPLFWIGLYISFILIFFFSKDFIFS